MEFNTKTFDEAAVKHALRTRHIVIVGDGIQNKE